MAGLPPVPRLTKDGFSNPSWQRWLILLRQAVVSSVVSLVIATKNGFSGTTSTSSDGVTTVTLSTTVTGLVKGVSGGLAAATANTDYVASITLSGDAAGTFSGGELPVTLVETGVTAGTYGSGTIVPQITVDGKGRLSLVTNLPIPPIPIAVGSTTSRPSMPVNGVQYLDTTIGQPIWALSTAATGWINSAGVSV